MYDATVNDDAGAHDPDETEAEGERETLNAGRAGAEDSSRPERNDA